MQFVLKDGFIHIVKNQDLANNKIEGDVIIKYVDDFENKKFSYSINGSKFKPIVNEKLIIEQKDLEGNELNLKIKAKSKDSVEYFKADKVPITYAVILGEPMEEAYSEAINSLNKQIDRLNQYNLKQVCERLGEVEERVKNLEEEGEFI